jgi:hypothetical protein
MAGVYVGPEQMTQAGRVFTLAFQQKNSSRAIYEYTENNQTVKNWTTLVTLNYTSQPGIDARAWASATRTGLERNRPKPHYDLYLKGRNAYARLIFEPDAANPDYEANVQKSFHLPDCGTVVLQYAIKFPKTTELSAIKTETDKMAADMEQDGWQPVCSQAATP